MTTSYQPVSDLQLNQLKVEWVEHGTVKPNKYNPNRMTAVDRALLRQSILEDGWTQPIVTLPDGTIVDGEQRWTTAGLPLHTSEIDAIIEKMDRRKAEGFPESDSILSRLRESRRRLAEVQDSGKKGTLASITGGLVPITRVDFGDDAHKMISTIRHNRARGTHNLDAMAEITQDLQQLGLDFDDLEVRLGMDDEEIRRLLEQADLPDQLDAAEPTQAWEPVHISALTDDEILQREMKRSAAVDAEAKAYQLKLKEREQEIARQKEAEVAKREAEIGHSLNQDQKRKIVGEISSSIPVPPPPKPPDLRVFHFYVTPSEYKICDRVLTDDGRSQSIAVTFVALCLEEYKRKWGEVSA